MNIPGALTELRTWPATRRMIAGGVSAFVVGALVVASGTVGFAGGSVTFPGSWWGYVVVAAGSGLVGLIVAGYFHAPIGAAATMCDLRWPVLGVISLYLSTDLRTAVPLLAEFVRPVVAVAAIALLVWALLERLAGEYRAVAGRDRSETAGADGEVCTTCRPLFPNSAGR
ncbi:hypothetical protein RCH16_001627 [Cryobacterium sp. MP_M5]|uniref:hypothetical protein n=1 Tax=unclassified Cryobacterium TaxID=2649013 RepID=UPI0018CAE6BA|nr:MULTISPECIES: hypothetical protein [unclassified Cryobacterium]MBG6058137.1 hypothetical protein [Cryobacterium sp. MP_M3]MEC5176619.1 hypothetical protein [Cryobacterium sp. MP_M5]